MKVGMRKPSIKKSISARTTGKAKRKLKKAVILVMGKKELVSLRTPKKLCIIKCIIKQLLAFGICSSKRNSLRAFLFQKVRTYIRKELYYE